MNNIESFPILIEYCVQSETYYGSCEYFNSQDFPCEASDINMCISKTSGIINSILKKIIINKRTLYVSRELEKSPTCWMVVPSDFKDKINNHIKYDDDIFYDDLSLW